MIHYPDRRGSKNSNAKLNLRWGTRKENMSDCLRHGTHTRGERNGSAKLTKRDVKQIRKLFGQRKNRDEIGKQFNIGKRHVYKIANSETWL